MSIIVQIDSWGCGSDSGKMQGKVWVSAWAFVSVSVHVHLCDRETERVSGSKRVNPRGDEGSVCLWLTLALWSPQTDGLIESLSRPLADNGSFAPLSAPGSQSEKQHGSQESHTLHSLCCSVGKEWKKNVCKITQDWIVFIYVFIFIIILLYLFLWQPCC